MSLSGVPSTVPTSYSVTYSCTFNNNWSAANHPFNYPSNAHWSPPVLVAHGSKYSVWEPNRFASKGVEQVAETGGTSKLAKKLGKAQSKSRAGDYVMGEVTFNSNVQSQTFDDIDMTPWFDRMSTITMIAPSPDWYTGFYSMKPTTNDGFWLESFDIATYPWDAGTETGDDFDTDNPAQSPREKIKELNVDSVPDNGVFLSPDGTEVLPVATWTCTLVDSSCSDHDQVAQGGRVSRNCAWAGAQNARTREKRCKKRFMGKPLAVWCPAACGVCDPEA